MKEDNEAPHVTCVVNAKDESVSFSAALQTSVGVKSRRRKPSNDFK